jgi:photosystem II stability/assembly factor-like uncharacterized protein
LILTRAVPLHLSFSTAPQTLRSAFGVLVSTGTKRVATGQILLAIFMLYLCWYFLASYLEHHQPVKVDEKMLTPHDDLFAVDGSADGNTIVVGKFGSILLSADGGKSWQARSSGTAQVLSAVSFADKTHGFVVGSAGTLLATDDGGATWRAQNSGTKEHLLAVHAVSANQIFAVGAFGTLLSSSDGGRSWLKHDMKWEVLIERIVKEGGLVEPNLNAVHFASPESGWIAGEFGLILHTNDGGRNWNSQRYGSDLPQLYSVKFVDDRHGIAAGQAGTLLQTSNGGQLWSAINAPVKRDLYHVSFDGERGMIVGDGVMLASRDAGSTWRQLESKPTDPWFSGANLNGNNALLVGGAGTTRLLALEKAKPQTESKAP